MSRILVVACCSLVVFQCFIAITTAAEAHCTAGTAAAGYRIEAASVCTKPPSPLQRGNPQLLHLHPWTANFNRESTSVAVPNTTTSAAPTASAPLTAAPLTVLTAGHCITVSTSADKPAFSTSVYEPAPGSLPLTTTAFSSNHHIAPAPVALSSSRVIGLEPTASPLAPAAHARATTLEAIDTANPLVISSAKSSAVEASTASSSAASSFGAATSAIQPASFPPSSSSSPAMQAPASVSSGLSATETDPTATNQGDADSCTTTSSHETKPTTATNVFPIPNNTPSPTGLCGPSFQCGSMPCWVRGSIGWLSDDGDHFCCDVSGAHFGPISTVGDTMGCGIAFRDGDASSTITVSLATNVALYERCSPKITIAGPEGVEPNMSIAINDMGSPVASEATWCEDTCMLVLNFPDAEVAVGEELTFSVDTQNPETLISPMGAPNTVIGGISMINVTMDWETDPLTWQVTVDQAMFETKAIAQSTPYPAALNTLIITIQTNVDLAEDCVAITISGLRGACMETEHDGFADLDVQDNESSRFKGSPADTGNSRARWVPEEESLIFWPAGAGIDGDTEYVIHVDVRNKASAQVSLMVYIEASEIPIVKSVMDCNLTMEAPDGVFEGTVSRSEGNPFEVHGLTVAPEHTKKVIGQFVADAGAANVITVTIQINVQLTAASTESTITSDPIDIDVDTEATYGVFEAEWIAEREMLVLAITEDTLPGKDDVISWEVTNPILAQGSKSVFIESSGIVIQPQMMEPDSGALETLDDEADTMGASTEAKAPLFVLAPRLIECTIYKTDGTYWPAQDSKITMTFTPTVVIEPVLGCVVSIHITGLRGVVLEDEVVEISGPDADKFIDCKELDMEDCNIGMTRWHQFNSQYTLNVLKKLEPFEPMPVKLAFENAVMGQEPPADWKTPDSSEWEEIPSHAFLRKADRALFILPSASFVTKQINQSTSAPGAANTLTIVLEPQFTLTGDEESTITTSGLTGSTGSTTDKNMKLLDANPTFNSIARWIARTGTLVLLVAPGEEVPAGENSVIMFDLANPNIQQEGPQLVQVLAVGDKPVSAAVMELAEGDSAPLKVVSPSFTELAVTELAVGANTTTPDATNVITVTFQADVVLSSSRRLGITIQGLVGKATESTMALPITRPWPNTGTVCKLIDSSEPSAIWTPTTSATTVSSKPNLISTPRVPTSFVTYGSAATAGCLPIATADSSEPSSTSTMVSPTSSVVHGSWATSDRVKSVTTDSSQPTASTAVPATLAGHGRTATAGGTTGATTDSFEPSSILTTAVPTSSLACWATASSAARVKIATIISSKPTASTAEPATASGHGCFATFERKVGEVTDSSEPFVTTTTAGPTTLDGNGCTANSDCFLSSTTESPAPSAISTTAAQTFSVGYGSTATSDRFTSETIVSTEPTASAAALATAHGRGCTATSGGSTATGDHIPSTTSKSKTAQSKEFPINVMLEATAVHGTTALWTGLVPALQTTLCATDLTAHTITSPVRGPPAFATTTRTGNGVEGCTDVDKCQGPCDANVMCTNLNGNSSCACDDGSTGGEWCKDLDECGDGSDNCDTNPVCNTLRGFECTCVSGCSGNRLGCSEIDECEDGSKCDPVHGNCSDEAGVIECSCLTGYNSSNGRMACLEVHECELRLDSCWAGTTSTLKAVDTINRNNSEFSPDTITVWDVRSASASLMVLCPAQAMGIKISNWAPCCFGVREPSSPSALRKETLNTTCASLIDSAVVFPKAQDVWCDQHRSVQTREATQTLESNANESSADVVVSVHGLCSDELSLTLTREVASAYEPSLCQISTNAGISIHRRCSYVLNSTCTEEVSMKQQPIAYDLSTSITAVGNLSLCESIRFSCTLGSVMVTLFENNTFTSLIRCTAAPNLCSNGVRALRHACFSSTSQQMQLAVVFWLATFAVCLAISRGKEAWRGCCCTRNTLPKRPRYSSLLPLVTALVFCATVGAVTRTELLELISSCTGGSSTACAAVEEADTSTIRDMSRMFSFSSFNGNISGWNVASVTNMAEMFRQSSFNGNLSTWDTSRVTTMESIFYSSSFNGNITGWNVASVTNMYAMFRQSPFNGNIANWNTGAVNNMREMFRSSSFTGNISQWDVSKVTTMEGMFVWSSLSSFNGDISAWNVASVTTMAYMFGESSFNGDISRWNTGAVKRMDWMFYQSSFNGDISAWNVASVTTMQGMFWGSSFNGNISAWDVTSVASMQGMFYSSSFNGNIANWDVSKVETMEQMFYASSFNGNIANWDVSKVETMEYMFYYASSFNGDISKWNTGAVETMEQMFFRASSFNGDISKWNTGGVNDMGYMFYDSSSFTGNISKWNVSAVKDMSYMFEESAFYGDLCAWNLSQRTSGPSMVRQDGMFVNSFLENSDFGCQPTCNDKEQNEHETTVDCGGTYSCQTGCAVGISQPQVASTTPVTPGCLLQFSPEDIDSLACAKAPVDSPNCQEARKWEQLYLEYKRTGANPAFVTGGLGSLMTKDKFEVWVCLRGHPCLLEAGVNPAQGDLMCFVYDEGDRRFIPCAEMQCDEVREMKHVKADTANRLRTVFRDKQSNLNLV